MSESSSDEEAGSEEGARDETGAGADAVGGAGASAVSFDESAARARSPGEDFNSPGVCFVSSDGPVSFEGSVWAAGDGCDSVATGANSSWTSASRTTAMFGSGRTGARRRGRGDGRARRAHHRVRHRVHEFAIDGVRWGRLRGGRDLRLEERPEPSGRVTRGIVVGGLGSGRGASLGVSSWTSTRSSPRARVEGAVFTGVTPNVRADVTGGPIRSPSGRTGTLPWVAEDEK